MDPQYEVGQVSEEIQFQRKMGGTSLLTSPRRLHPARRHLSILPPLPCSSNSKLTHHLGSLRRTLFPHLRYQPRDLSLPNRMRAKTHRNLGQMRNSPTKKREERRCFGAQVLFRLIYQEAACLFFLLYMWIEEPTDHPL